MMKMLRILPLLLLLAGPGAQAADAPPDASAYLITNLTKAAAAAGQLAKQAKDLPAAGADGQVPAMQQDFHSVANDSYEAVRAIVAGVPELAGYDGILEAGTKAASLTLKDAQVANPGPLLTGVLGPALWSTDVQFTLQGHAYSRPDVIAAAAGETDKQIGSLLAAARAWKPTPDNCHAALAASAPLISGYFDDWQQASFGDPPSGLFKAKDRLDDLKQFVGGCRILLAGFQKELTAKNAAAASSIASDLSALSDLADETKQRASVGQFSTTNADEPGNQAQQLVADLLQKLQAPLK